LATRRLSSRTTLVNTITDMQRRLKYLSNRPAPSRLAAYVVTTGNIQPRAVDTDQLALDAVTDAQISPNAVTNEAIAEQAVDTENLANESVGYDQLQDASVGEAKLQDGIITESKLSNSAITEVKIAPGSITQDKVLPGSVIATNITRTDDSNSIRVERQESTAGGSTYKIAVNFGIDGSSTFAARSDHSHGGATGETGSLELQTHFHSISSSSSVRVKKEITDYEVEDVRAILSLVPKRYKYRNQARMEQESTNREWMFGYLVEDLLGVGVEEPVTYDRDGEPEGINYSLLVLRVVELLKAQDARIAELEAVIRSQEDGA
jgi:hypothetical protein